MSLLIVQLLIRKEKAQAKQNLSQTKGVGLIERRLSVNGDTKCVDDCFSPFLFEGLVPLNGSPDDQCSVHILRDAACSHSVILSSVLPFSEKSTYGYNTEPCDDEMGHGLKPVHNVHITSKLVNGCFPVAISLGLPIHGIDLLMGGKVTPTPALRDL